MFLQSAQSTHEEGQPVVEKDDVTFMWSSRFLWLFSLD